MNKKRVINELLASAILVASLWALKIIDVVLPINQFGIMPRTIPGAKGIFLSPFLHADFNHLIANSTVLFLFVFLLLRLMKSQSVPILFLMVVLSGLGTWIIGRGGVVHIGASGVIFALFGFFVSYGIFRKSLRAIVISIAVIALYGGIIAGVLPSAPHISWEGHLSGFISGIILAKRFS